MSGATIREFQRDAAKKAARQHLTPFIVEREDIADWKENGVRSFPFPFIGDYVPKGWDTVKDEEDQDVKYFVDSSGFGEDNEPALSLRRFVEKLEPGFGYAVTEAGQFQVYVEKFHKIGSRVKAQ